MPSTPSQPYRIHLCSDAAEQQRALDIRIEVFVNEQKFSMEDEIDDSRRQLRGHDSMACSHGQAGSTSPAARTSRTGAGRLLVEALEEHVRLARGKGGIWARENGVKEVEIEAMAQHQAQPFYEKCGYTRVGDRIIEDGYPHVKMLKRVKIEL